MNRPEKAAPKARTRVLDVARLSDLPALLALLERGCAQVGADAQVLHDLRLATEEVFTNSLVHGEAGTRGAVRVSLRATPQAITVTLADAAPAFDPRSLPAADTGSDWQQRAIGGLGWHLVYQLMDEVHRAPSPGGGNVYTLVKKLPPRHPSDSTH